MATCRHCDGPTWPTEPNNKAPVLTQSSRARRKVAQPNGTMPLDPLTDKCGAANEQSDSGDCPSPKVPARSSLKANRPLCCIAALGVSSLTVGEGSNGRST